MLKLCVIRYLIFKFIYTAGFVIRNLNMKNSFIIKIAVPTVYGSVKADTKWYFFSFNIHFYIVDSHGCKPGFTPEIDPLSAFTCFTFPILLGFQNIVFAYLSVFFFLYLIYFLNRIRNINQNAFHSFFIAFIEYIFIKRSQDIWIAFRESLIQIIFKEMMEKVSSRNRSQPLISRPFYHYINRYIQNPVIIVLKRTCNQILQSGRTHAYAKFFFLICIFISICLLILSLCFFLFLSLFLYWLNQTLYISVIWILVPLITGFIDFICLFLNSVITKVLNEEYRSTVVSQFNSIEIWIPEIHSMIFTSLQSILYKLSSLLVNFTGKLYITFCYIQTVDQHLIRKHRRFSRWYRSVLSRKTYNKNVLSFCNF